MIRPVIYQTLPRTFGANSRNNTPGGTKEQNGCGKMNDYTAKVLKAIRDLGCNYVWYTGLIEHATQTDYSAIGITPDNPTVVKGRAGSPYAIKDYYDIDPDLAADPTRRQREFDNLIARTHRAGLKMIIDFVPNHVARQYHSDQKPLGVSDLGEDDNTTIAFSKHNNFYYMPGETLSTQNFCPDPVVPYLESPARATGNDCFSAYPGRCDWYETVKLNYGVDYLHERQQFFYPDIPSTWNKMLDILRYWATRGIDGFRCDMAEMVPVEFWAWAIPQVKSEHPGIIFIAEVYNPAQYHDYIFRGQFDYLYDKVGRYDTLRRVMGGESASLLTQCWQSVEGISDHMLNFLENHDEQRIASDFFAADPLKGRPALLVSALMRNNPFMLYQAQHLGEAGMEAEGFSGRDGRSTIFDYWTIDSLRRWVNNGRIGTEHLTADEQALHQFYSRVLNLANSETALREGLFYDLMYANYDNPLMDTNHQYAFIRKTGKEMVLVVANFEDKKVETDIRLPRHALQYLEITEGPYFTTELLTGATQTVDVEADCLVRLTLEPLCGAILKFER